MTSKPELVQLCHRIQVLSFQLLKVSNLTWYSKNLKFYTTHYWSYCVHLSIKCFKPIFPKQLLYGLTELSSHTLNMKQGFFFYFKIKVKFYYFIPTHPTTNAFSHAPDRCLGYLCILVPIIELFTLYCSFQTVPSCWVHGAGLYLQFKHCCSRL